MRDLLFLIQRKSVLFIFVIWKLDTLVLYLSWDIFNCISHFIFYGLHSTFFHLTILIDFSCCLLNITLDVLFQFIEKIFGINFRFLVILLVLIIVVIRAWVFTAVHIFCWRFLWDWRQKKFLRFKTIIKFLVRSV